MQYHDDMTYGAIEADSNSIKHTIDISPCVASPSSTHLTLVAKSSDNAHLYEPLIDSSSQAHVAITTHFVLPKTYTLSLALTDSTPAELALSSRHPGCPHSKAPWTIPSTQLLNRYGTPRARTMISSTTHIKGPEMVTGRLPAVSGLSLTTAVLPPTAMATGLASMDAVH
jgi:hypothetical protein